MSLLKSYMEVMVSWTYLVPPVLVISQMGIIFLHFDES